MIELNLYLAVVLIVGAFSLGWFGAKLGYWVLDQLFGSAKHELVEFMKAFPGRCPVCSYYEYGLLYGYAKPATRPLHYCIQNPPERTCNDIRN